MWGPTSPHHLIHEGHLYWVNDRGIAHCVDAKTGKVVFQKRLSGAPQVYASAVLAAGKLYVVSREAGTFVLAAKSEFEQLAHNELKSDSSVFNASPAWTRKAAASFQPISLQYRAKLIRLASP